MIWFYCQQRVQRILRFLKTANSGQLVTAGLFLLVFAGVGLGVYGLLEAGFQSVANNEFLQTALPLFVYELFLLVVAALVFASSLIFGIFTLFKNKQDQWVLASPQYSSLLTEKLLSVNLISLWPLAVIAIPALIAVQSVFGIGTLGFLYGLLTILLLAVLASTAALVLIITLGYLITAISNSTGWNPGLTTLITTASAISLFLFAGSWLQLGSIDIVRFFEATNLERSTANITAIQDIFRYFPSHWVAQTLSALQTGSLAAGVMTSWPIVAATAAMLVAYRSFYGSFLSVWQHFQEGGFEAKTARPQTSKTKEGAQFSNNSVAAVFKKEWITLVRNKRNLLWLGFLLLLWLTVTGFDIFMQNNLAGEDLVSNVSTPELIQALQLVVVGYFLGAMILRFVFPAFSMERDTAWSIITAPLSRNRLFWAKAGFFVLLFSVISLAIGVVHVSILGGSLASTLSFLFYTLIISITLSLTGLASGARFPNFTTADPEKLSTTLPGLGFITVAVVYSSACAYGYFLFASGQPVISIIGVLLVSLLLATTTTVSALHKLPTTDFTARVES